MKEIKKDLFECIFDKDVDAICITTNGHYTKDGIAVMGGGCAGVAARKWPDMPKRLGMCLKKFKRNVPYIIGAVDEDGKSLEVNKDLFHNKKFKCLVFSYPTIDDLMDGANIPLIVQSAKIMADYANQLELKNIVCARMGVGIGGLDWDDVKPEIVDILDDRFTIVSFAHEK